MIQAVLFDFYETLVTHYRSPLYFGAQIAADCGVPAERFLPLWRDADREARRTLGQLTLAEELREILPLCGQTDLNCIEPVCQKRTQVKQACMRTLHPGVLPMLWGLKARGLRLGLISNCYLEEAQVIEDWPEGRCFDAMLLSCREGLRKPDPAIYRRCVQQLGVAPEACLFIGDGGSRELEAAQALGMQAMQAAWYIGMVPGHDSPVKGDFRQVWDPAEVVEEVFRT